MTDKEDFNRLERDERRFKDKNQRVKERKPYKRDKTHWSQLALEDEESDDDGIERDSKATNY